MSLLPFRARVWIQDRRERAAVVRAARQEIQRLLGEGSVLEIGCGIGANAAGRHGRYFGVDPNPAAIAEARRRYPDHRFLCGTVADLSLCLDEYATVLFCAVLHELADRDQILRQAAALGCPRVLVCDFDPQGNFGQRLMLRLLEPPAINTFWTFDPAAVLEPLGWQVRTGRVSPRIVYWDCRRPEIAAATGG